jgi:hypothetical protein
MSYSILRIYNLAYTNVFEEFIQKIDLKDYDYEKVAKLFFGLKVAYSNSFSRCMNDLHNKSEEIIFNLNYLQRLWNSKSNTNSNFEILLKQIEEYKPDVIFFQGAPPISIRELKMIKKKFPFIKKTVIHCGFQINDEILEETDVLLLASPHLYNLYKEKIKNIHIIYHYFDEDVLNHVKLPSKKNYLVFCGKTGSLNNKDHYTRFNLLNKICYNFDIKCYSQEFSKKENKPLSQFKTINLFLKRILKRDIFLHDNHLTKILEPVFGLEMYQKIIESHAVLNSHVNYNKEPIDFSANMRLFEATGVGTAVFTENSKNIYEIFNKDQIIVYKNDDDLISKINYYQNNLDELIVIGKKSQEHTLKFHTAKVRIKEINQLILNYL